MEEKLREVKEMEEVLEQEEELTEKSYHIVLHNDDFVPVELVVAILMDVFKYSFPKAMSIITEVERDGLGVIKSGLSFGDADSLVKESDQYCKSIVGNACHLTLTIEE